MNGLVCDGRPEVEQVCRLVAGVEDADNVRLEGIEKLGCVDRCVDNRLSRWVCFGLDVWEEESQRMSRLCGEDREERNELRCLVVGQICEDERLRVVLVDSVVLSAWARRNGSRNASSSLRTRRRDARRART